MSNDTKRILPCFLPKIEGDEKCLPVEIRIKKRKIHDSYQQLYNRINEDNRKIKNRMVRININHIYLEKE